MCASKSDEVKDQIELRSPRPDEIDDLARLDRSLWGEFAYPATMWRQMLEAAGPLLVIACSESELIGYGVILPRTIAGEGWFIVLGVRPENQGGGTGKALMRSLLERATESGIHTVHSTVAPNNRQAIELHESVGFEHERFAEAFFGPGKDRIIMRYRAP